MAYQIPEGRGLRQGDILAGVRTFTVRSMSEDDIPTGSVITYGHAVVVTQDCDLEQDFRARFAEGDQEVPADKLLYGILLCGVYHEDICKAGKHRDKATALGSKEWRTVQQNQSPRYQFLGHVPQLGGRYVADFKDFFMVPCDFLYEEIRSERAKRATEMVSPYREHLLQRFAWYLMRVGLPRDFHDLVE
jgi:hypothetical protein